MCKLVTPTLSCIWILLLLFSFEGDMVLILLQIYVRKLGYKLETFFFKLHAYACTQDAIINIIKNKHNAFSSAPAFLQVCKLPLVSF